MGTFKLTLAGVIAWLALSPPAGAQAPADCDGPPTNPAPGSAAWHQREQDNDYCGEQRAADTEANPAFAAPSFQDPYRDPSALDGKRFRYQPVSYTNSGGKQIGAMLFRPLAGGSRPPYPGVVVVHGGSARQEMYLWGAEALAEAGYMVLTFQVPTEDNTGGGNPHPHTQEAPRRVQGAPGPHPPRRGG